MREFRETHLPFIPYVVFDSLEINKKKYIGKKRNAYESRRRLSKLKTIQIFSNSICADLQIPEFKLQATGSAKAGYARKESDLDIFVIPGKNHIILTNRNIREMYARKMQFLLNASKNIDFPVYIFFVRK